MFKKRKNTSIRVCTSWERHPQEPHPGVLIEVIQGLDALHCVYGEDEQHAYLTLSLRDVPLFQLQGDEYYCPTCEKIIRAAYALGEQDLCELPDINASKQDVSLAQAIQNITPLLSLLPSGYYVILDTMLHPTDGNSHLFWDVPNTDVCSKGTCCVHVADFTYVESEPHFCVATQSTQYYNAQRVAYYRTHKDARAIAYHMDGFLCALLDGHHKAMAAALEKQDVSALVILPCDYGLYPQEEVIVRASNGLQFHAQECGVSSRALKQALQTSRKKTTTRNSIKSLSVLPQTPIPPYPKDIVSFYPDVQTQACMDLVGDVHEERLHAILQGALPETREVTTLLMALLGLHHPLFWKIALYLVNKPYANDVKYELIKCMLQHPKKEEHLDDLISLSIAYEDCSYIKELLYQNF